MVALEELLDNINEGIERASDSLYNGSMEWNGLNPLRYLGLIASGALDTLIGTPKTCYRHKVDVTSLRENFVNHTNTFCDVAYSVGECAGMLGTWSGAIYIGGMLLSAAPVAALAMVGYVTVDSFSRIVSMGSDSITGMRKSVLGFSEPAEGWGLSKAGVIGWARQTWESRERIGSWMNEPLPAYLNIFSKS